MKQKTQNFILIKQKVIIPRAYFSKLLIYIGKCGIPADTILLKSLFWMIIFAIALLNQIPVFDV